MQPEKTTHVDEPQLLDSTLLPELQHIQLDASFEKSKRVSYVFSRLMNLLTPQ